MNRETREKRISSVQKKDRNKDKGTNGRKVESRCMKSRGRRE